ncbi:MAG: L,D-transpeptidase family protein [Oscillospiraceae bacterium]|jgi:hypothetical protein|nr:L,D-transpeptidase family protein [Oscillospiraceae bacterium]
MRRVLGFVLCISLLLAMAASAQAESPAYTSVPQVLRPGKAYQLILSMPRAGQAALQLLTPDGQPVLDILTGYPVTPGENTLHWNGLRSDQSPVAAGEYLLRIALEDGSFADTPLRIGAPYPIITGIAQSDAFFTETPIEITFTTSQPGTMAIDLLTYADDATARLAALPISNEAGSFTWDGTLNGQRVPAGNYALVLTLTAENGSESMPHQLPIEVIDPTAAAAPSSEIIIQEAPAPTTPPVSPPYSAIDDGSYWSMTPGETDPAKIWSVLMQPITIYNGVGATEHVYLMENPDGTGKQVAQIHGKSQGLHVIGEENEHGYVLVEAFSNYDRSYTLETDAERAHAFDLRQGYVRASGLKTIKVRQDLAIVIDKKSQRLYLYKDGVCVTELLIATGRVVNEEDILFETIAGEFITVSHTGGFWSGNMYCDMAIRINGGVLLHEVPYKENADGTKNYASFEAYLGSKQSHGCIRIQRLKNDEGYNQRWLWNNLERGAPYKVIIWDDRGRVDDPTTWYPNPD